MKPLLCSFLVMGLAVAQPAQPTLIFHQDDARLTEVSGVAVVRGAAGLWWMHNDSGDSARAFAVDGAGKIALTVNLVGAGAFDWEDMSAHDGWVYLGDIGDNFSIRTDVQVYRFAQPKIRRGALGQTLDLKEGAWEKTTLRYPDGAHNCESLAVTPDGRVLLVTKEKGGVSGFYRWNFPWKGGASGVLSKVAAYKFDGTSHKSRLATGADFSEDGRKLVVTTYTDLYEFRLARPFDFDSLDLQPLKQALPPQKQCEAVCYSLDGRTIYSTGEGARAPVWKLASRLR